jgi:heptosyltransferase-2
MSIRTGQHFVRMKSVLIIQTAFVGDVLLSTVLFENIKHSYPDASIDFLVKKGNESLLENHPFVNKVLQWDKKNGKYRNLFQLLKYIRKQRYDLVLNVQRFAATGILAAFSGAKRIIGYDKNPLSFLFHQRVKHKIGPDHSDMHETTRCNALLELVVPTPITKPSIYPTPDDYMAIAPYTSEPYLVIAPGSVWFTKQVPLQKWISIINRLPGDLPIYLIGSEKEDAIASALIESLPHRGQIHNLTGKLSFLQSAALMRGAVFNLVNDSAPLHLASAVDAPVIALYCSTSPVFGFTPLSTESHVIEVEEALPCRPCGLSGKPACPEKHFNCANRLNELKITQIVWDKLSRMGQPAKVDQASPAKRSYLTLEQTIY